MKIVASVNHKGGVGKTTLAVTLAHYLAKNGHPTLIIDLDGQGSTSRFLGLEPGPGLRRFLLGEKGQVAQFTGRENLWIISNSKDGNTAIERTVPSPDILASSLRNMPRLYDFVILDSAPSVGMLHTAPLLACDHYMIPVKLDQASMIGARSVTDSTNDLAHMVHVENIQKKFLGFMPNFWDRRLSDSRRWLKFLYDLDPALVFPPIPVDSRLQYAMGLGQTIWEFAPDARCVRGTLVDGVRVGGFLRAFDRLERALND